MKGFRSIDAFNTHLIKIIAWILNQFSRKKTLHMRSKQYTRQIKTTFFLLLNNNKILIREMNLYHKKDLSKQLRSGYLATLCVLCGIVGYILAFQS